MIWQGVIDPINLPEWAASIVPVLKNDGSIVICGDYNVIINQASQVDSYPLLIIDQQLISINGRWKEIFKTIPIPCLLYQKIPMDDASKKLVAINVHKGLVLVQQTLFSGGVSRIFMPEFPSV